MGIGFLKLFHIAFAATWFGVGLLITGDLRRTAQLGPPHLAPLWARLDRAGLIARIAALLTLVTGLALIFAYGGFAKVQPKFHAALGLMIVNIGLGIAMGRIGAGIKALGDETPFATLQPKIKRIAMLGGIHQLLWMVLLALMVLPI